MKVIGKISKILEVQRGTSKDGKEWQKQLFILDNNEKYNNIFCFEIFGDEKVENFYKYNKLGDMVEVEFNVSTNEWQGKYFTSLQVWKIMKSKDAKNIDTPFEMIPEGLTNQESDDLPF